MKKEYELLANDARENAHKFNRILKEEHSKII